MSRDRRFVCARCNQYRWHRPNSEFCEVCEPLEAQQRTIPTTCIETIGGNPDTAIRLSFQIKVF